MLNSFIYDELHHLSISRIAEYYTKLMMTLHKLDVYTTEVDNKGIDFIVRNPNGKYFDIQVKSIRYPNTSYVFIPKEGVWRDGNLRDNLMLALMVFQNHKTPELYLIPSTAWMKESQVLKNRTLYKVPEWGLNYSIRNQPLLEQFKLEKIIHTLLS